MKTADFAKGIGVGMIAGAALGMVIAPRRRSRKVLAEKTLRTAGEVMNSIAGALG